MTKTIAAALTLAGTLVLGSASTSAHHSHYVIIDNPATGHRTCQYVGHGQTSIDGAHHGGHHRIHDNVHTGTPGTDDHGTGFDKDSNLDASDCDSVRNRR